MQNIEQRVAVVTDTGSSMRPEDPLVEKLGISLLPLHVTFYTEDGSPESMHDTDLSVGDFYRRMREGKRLPETSGAVYASALETYKNLSEASNSIISIHLTAKHSAIHDDAILAAREMMGKQPGLMIEVVDSKQISLGTWFLAQHAAELANSGMGLQEIKQEVLQEIPKIHLYAVLASLENVHKGGRIPALARFVGQALQISPILNVDQGQVVVDKPVRGLSKARRLMVEQVKGQGKEIVRMAVLHTNAPELGKEIRELLAEFYNGEIPVREAGFVLGIHAGPNAVGVVYENV